MSSPNKSKSEQSFRGAAELPWFCVSTAVPTTGPAAGSQQSWTQSPWAALTESTGGCKPLGCLGGLWTQKMLTNTETGPEVGAVCAEAKGTWQGFQSWAAGHKGTDTRGGENGNSAYTAEKQ